MVQDHIRYDILVQDALRGVIRKVLSEVAKAGLPGEHHFFITFLTDASGVKVSNRLKERYPEQMTIVLQHQFWDLKVSDSGFEVSLSFGDIPEKLVIPFSAVQVFYDPTAAFEAAFDLPADMPISDNDSHVTPVNEVTLLPDVKDKKINKKKQNIEKAPDKKAGEPKLDEQKIDEAPNALEKPSADVVSLDSFRKK